MKDFTTYEWKKCEEKRWGIEREKIGVMMQEGEGLDRRIVRVGMR